MKKKLVNSIALVYLFTSIAAAPIVYAERTSQANIEFEATTGPTQPVDPDVPTTPLPGEPSVIGELAIVFISNFDFGQGIVSSAVQFYDIVTDRPNIQIVDLRGTGAGWELSASASGFTGAENQDTLRGAVIHIGNGRLNSETPMIHAPTVITDVALPTTNTPRKILTAGRDKGQGLWIDRLYPENAGNGAYVQLEVPAGVATVGAHTATITWTLSVGP